MTIHPQIAVDLEMAAIPSTANGEGSCIGGCAGGDGKAGARENGDGSPRCFPIKRAAIHDPSTFSNRYSPMHMAVWIGEGPGLCSCFGDAAGNGLKPSIKANA